MSDSLFSFSWPVAKAGYGWAGHGKPGGPWLRPLSDDEEYTIEDSLKDHSGLFRIFAETPPTEEGVLKFANKFGSLIWFHPRAFISIYPDGPLSLTNPPAPMPVTYSVFESKRDDGQYRYTPLSSWETEITAMSLVIKLQDMIRAGDREGLSKHFLWTEAGEIFTDIAWIHRKPASDNLNQMYPYPLFGRFQPGNVFRPALYIIKMIINHSLQDRLSPKIQCSQNATRLKLSFVPPSLVSALWLQCAQAVTGNWQYLKCKQCETWFEVAPSVINKGKIYCSDACKSKSYRNRQEQAQRLYTQGLPFQEIARRLDTDSQTAKRWVERMSSSNRNSGDTD